MILLSVFTKLSLAGGRQSADASLAEALRRETERTFAARRRRRPLRPSLGPR